VQIISKLEPVKSTLLSTIGNSFTEQTSIRWPFCARLVARGPEKAGALMLAAPFPCFVTGQVM
jgi:hypothetical protein